MREPRKLFGGLGNRLFQMAYLHAQEANGAIPDIYVQDPKYFENVGNKMRLMYRDGILENPLISLHIRRGDYLNNPVYVDLTQTDYYDRAIAQFPGETFLVFCADRQQGSDDISDREWCDTFLASKGIDYEFADGKDEIEDFNLMAGCKGHIMANSSFSWWASYAGSGKTVAPRDWFSDGIQRVGLLEEWITI